MDDMKYELLVELNSRMEADLLKSYLESQDIPVELFQESVGSEHLSGCSNGIGKRAGLCAERKLKQAKESALNYF